MWTSSRAWRSGIHDDRREDTNQTEIKSLIAVRKQFYDCLLVILAAFGSRDEWLWERKKEVESLNPRRRETNAETASCSWEMAPPPPIRKRKTKCAELILTWSCYPANIETMGVIHFEIILHNGPLRLALSSNRWKQIFRIYFIFDLLIAEIKENKSCNENASFCSSSAQIAFQLKLKCISMHTLVEMKQNGFMTVSRRSIQRFKHQSNSICRG